MAQGTKVDGGPTGLTIRFSMKNSIIRSALMPLWPRSGPTWTSKLLPRLLQRLDELHHVRRMHVVVGRAVVQHQPPFRFFAYVIALPAS